MRLFSTTFAAISLISTVGASGFHDNRLSVHRHSGISTRPPTVVHKPDIKKRCEPRDIDDSTEPSHDLPPPKPQPTSPPKSTGNVINVDPGICGSTGATEKTTKTSGPNGSIDFLNCGLPSKWTPPYVTISDLIYKPLPATPSGGIFAACSKYHHLFVLYGNQTGIPPIMLASFAMQESSCNPNVLGEGGEQGLMQLTQEKCRDGDCRDPDYNIRTGAEYFLRTLKEKNGSVIEATGNYNGWKVGMSLKDATAAAKSNCCRCQNNLDYLHQFFNGWLQNINAYDAKLRIGKFFNLDVCLH